MINSMRLSVLWLCLLAACGGERAPDSKSTAPADNQAGQQMAMTRTPSPPGARVFFITPADGAVVPTTFPIVFGVEGMTVVKAGDATPGSGHHHLLIDTELPDMNLPIPADANHVHFGDGSTSTERTLPPGRHTLQLLFADHLHIPHDPPVYSERITITVE
jgi:Domain of unknown function (DUF4399)